MLNHLSYIRQLWKLPYAIKKSTTKALPQCKKIVKEIGHSPSRQLHTLNASSTSLTYAKELEIAGMMDNSGCSRVVISLEERLQLLRERERRWMNLDWKWRQCVDMPDMTSSSDSDYGISGGMYLHGDSDESPVGLYSARLPFEKNEKMEWDRISLGKVILTYGKAIDEHDLIAFLTCTPCSSDSSSRSLQVHLIQHSTRLPHPLATSPIIDICIQRESQGDPLVSILVCHDNLAIVTCSEYIWAGKLHVWDWKTGEKKGDAHIDEPRLGLAFLKEDILMIGNLTNMSLDIYQILSHISHGGNRLRLIQQFCMPKINDDRYETFSITFRSDPSSMSTSSTRNILLNHPFVNDPLSAILLVNIDIKIADFGSEPRRHFALIMHRRTLLDHVLERLSSCLPNSNDSNISQVSWEEWGPSGTRFLPFDARFGFEPPTSGTRCIIIQNHGVEVIDFGKWKVAAARLQNKTATLNTTSESEVQVELVDTPTVYHHSKNSVFLQDISSCLPYIRSRYISSSGVIGQSEDGMWDKQWDSILMDNKRIVGLRERRPDSQVEQMDVLYFG